jgi:S1-C subfamily serine protease
VTNAHVVGGTVGTRVHLPDGRILAARVVLFDPERDVAVLYVPGLSLGALPMAGAGAGTQGAAIGYPNGGPERVSPAVIDQSVYAQGRDIYEQNLVTRQIWVIEAQVLPGNSGGPLVNLNGQVVGMVFAASTSQPGQAYALTDTEIQPDIQDGSGATQATGDGSCAL